MITPEQFLSLTTNSKLLKRITESYDSGNRGSREPAQLAISCEGKVLMHDGRHRALEAIREGAPFSVQIRWFKGHLPVEEQRERWERIDDQWTAYFGEDIPPPHISQLTGQYTDYTVDYSAI